jgi:hypothetical protein
LFSNIFHFFNFTSFDFCYYFFVCIISNDFLLNR